MWCHRRQHALAGIKSADIRICDARSHKARVSHMLARWAYVAGMGTSDDIPGLIGDLLRVGVVESVALADATVTVRAGDIVSPPCPWLELAGAFRSWTPPSVGEQVVLLCPEGDIAHSIALRGLFSTAFPAPLDDARGRLLMPDGTTIDYDPEGHVLAIALASGSVTINAPHGVAITGDVTISGNASIVGNLDVSGTATGTEDVIGGGKSLKSHKHTGVQAGPAQTGAPA